MHASTFLYQSLVPTILILWCKFWLPSSLVLFQTSFIMRMPIMRLHYFIRIIGTRQCLVIFLDEFLAVITGCSCGFLFRYLIGMIWIDLSLCCVDALGPPFSCHAPRHISSSWGRLPCSCRALRWGFVCMVLLSWSECLVTSLLYYMCDLLLFICVYRLCMHGRDHRYKETHAPYRGFNIKRHVSMGAMQGSKIEA